MRAAWRLDQEGDKLVAQRRPSLSSAVLRPWRWRFVDVSHSVDLERVLVVAIREGCGLALPYRLPRRAAVCAERQYRPKSRVRRRRIGRLAGRC